MSRFIPFKKKLMDLSEAEKEGRLIQYSKWLQYNLEHLEIMINTLKEQKTIIEKSIDEIDLILETKEYERISLLKI